MKPFRGLSAAVLVLALGPCAFAALKWDAQMAELKLQRGIDADGRVHFDCVNTGSKTVTITGITTACGCTTATPETETIPPGQRERVWVIFSVGQRHGTVTKEITLRTDDPETPETVLKLRVAIAEEAQAPGKTPKN